MNPDQQKLSPRQISTAMICFNKEIRIVEENASYCRIRVKLQHRGAARLYGKFFPLRDYHDYILEGLGLAFFRQFKEHPVSLKEAVEKLRNEHKLSYFEALTLIRDYTGRLMRRGIIVLEIKQ